MEEFSVCPFTLPSTNLPASSLLLPYSQPAHSIAASLLPFFTASRHRPLPLLPASFPTTSLLPSAESPLPLHSTFYFPSPIPFLLSIHFFYFPIHPEFNWLCLEGLGRTFPPSPPLLTAMATEGAATTLTLFFPIHSRKVMGPTGQPAVGRAQMPHLHVPPVPLSFPTFIHFASVSPTTPLICMHSQNTYSRRRARNCRHPTPHSHHQHPFRRLDLLPRLPRQRRTISPLLRSSCLVLCKNFIARGEKAIFDAVAKIYFRPSSHNTIESQPKIVRSTIIHLILLFPSTIHCHFHSFYIFLLFIFCSLVVYGLFCLCLRLCPMILLSMFCPSPFQYFPSK